MGNYDIDKKLEECDAIEEERKKVQDKGRNQARAKNSKARTYLDSGLKIIAMGHKNLPDAIRHFRKCLHLAKDNDTEAECLANFHIGECMFKMGINFETARAHLVDFQIFCQMKSEKSPDVASKFKLASHLIN